MAFIFVPLLAFTALITTVVWAYASHVFVVVVEDTASGNEILVWDDEPMFDWLWQSVYVAWLVGVWLVPAALIARLATGGIDGDGRYYVFALIAFSVFWATFPLSLLSSMVGESRMTILHGELFQRLAKCLGHVLSFYLLSSLIIAACVPLATWLFVGQGIPSIVAGAVLLTLAFLLYARLMGRLACLARLTRIRTKKEVAKKKAKRTRGVKVDNPWDVPDEVQREEAARGVGFTQPSEMDGLETPYEGEVTGYDVSFAQVVKPEPPPALPLRRSRPIPASEPERVGPAASRATTTVEPDKLEMARLSRKKEKPPENPWGIGVWLFPFQGKTAVTWVTLALGVGLIAACVRVLQETWPW